MPSAELHPEEYLKERGRLIGPIRSHQALASLHFNRFGVIPKKHNTGKWRLITDFSFLDGKSVNDRIRSSLCSLSYTTVDDVAKIVAQLGRGALLAMIDLVSVSPHTSPSPRSSPSGSLPERRNILGSHAPIWSTFSSKNFRCGGRWAGLASGATSVVGPPEAGVCQRYVDIMERECTWLGVPLAAHKKEGPTTCLGSR